jgi:hypothetical protein
MTKLELKSSHEVIDTVNVADVESIFYCKPTDPDILTVVMKDGKRLYCDEVCPVDSLPEEPVSEELEEAAEQDVCEVVNECSAIGIPNDQIPSWVQDAMINEFIHGAKWQKEHLWKPADGDCLPEIDREVIALLDNGKVVYAHRPPEYWDGKDIVTGKITRNYPKTYDKGGWNIPNLKYWLDYPLPE